jgi:uncharacterized membrane protein YeaQ/YmgE (transglycosylase-associated protein family)
MKISFPKYGPGELLITKLDAPSIIWSMMIGFFAGLCGSYLLKNHFWLLMTAVLGVVSILLCLGAAAGIFLNWSNVAGAPSAKEAPSVSINENVPRLTPQWDYRPRKPIRACGALDSPSTKTSDDLSPDLFVTNDTVWCNDNSLEGATAAFINSQPGGEELRMKVLSEPTDTVCAAPTADDAAVRGTTKVL